jgi:hypothetical protein
LVWGLVVALRVGVAARGVRVGDGVGVVVGGAAVGVGGGLAVGCGVTSAGRSIALVGVGRTSRLSQAPNTARAATAAMVTGSHGRRYHARTRTAAGGGPFSVVSTSLLPCLRLVAGAHPTPGQGGTSVPGHTDPTQVAPALDVRRHDLTSERHTSRMKRDLQVRIGNVPSDVLAWTDE